MLSLLFAATPSITAQEHMTFMGIPINGTITEFQRKLETKGFKKNEYISRTLQNGIRTFNGTFASYPCFAEVLYSPKTKIVYQTSVATYNNDEERANNIYKDLKNLLDTKYQNIESKDTLANGLLIHSYGIKSSDDTHYIGEIYIFNKSFNCYGIDSNWVIIGYVDYENKNKLQLERLNDL